MAATLTKDGRSSDLESGVAVPQSENDPAPAPSDKAIALIEERIFLRDCLSRCLETRLDEKITTFDTTESFLAARGRDRSRLIILCAPGDAHDAELRRQLLALGRDCEGIPVMLLSNREQPNFVVSAVEMGVRGYITTSLSLDVVAEAIRLVDAGGVFVPVQCLIGGRRPVPDLPLPTGGDFFTTRQSAVVDALRRGKANKTIAFELNMRESTVKVHVRNIMKKLKARNRTEVAYLANELLKSD